MSGYYVFDENDVVVNIIEADDQFVLPGFRLEKIPEDGKARRGMRRVAPDTFEDLEDPTVKYDARGRKKVNPQENP